jgi:NAD(P)-dependent dehydrogenase (short-subunit alcohol dehydrogenase family)
MTELLTGRTAVVTGGASGIGRAIAITFAESGGNVVVADLREDPRGGGIPTHEHIQAETQASSHYVECDVTNSSDLVAAVDAADRWGGVDIMVNNAGIARPENFFDTTEEEYQQITDVNIKGVFFGSQTAAERMLQTGEGSIINISSIAGIAGSSMSMLYSLTKGAVRLFTYSLANQLGSDGIRVNAIHPGFIASEMTHTDLGVGHDDTARTERMIDSVPSGRIGTPQDIADAALFLASDLSSYVNAESLVVDGGRINTL